MKNKKDLRGTEVSLEEVEKELGKQETWGKAREEVERYNVSWQNSSEKDNLEGRVQNKLPAYSDRRVVREELYANGIWHRLEYVKQPDGQEGGPFWYRYKLFGSRWRSFYQGTETPFLKPPAYEQVAQKLAAYRCFVNDDVEQASQEEITGLKYLGEILNDVDTVKARMLQAHVFDYVTKALQWREERPEREYERLIRKDLLGVITPEEERNLESIENYLADQSH